MLVNEPDASAVRSFLAGRDGLSSSACCRAELSCVLHRHVREGGLTTSQARALHDLFREDVDGGTWDLVPLSTDLLGEVEDRVRRLGAQVFLRAGDAVHLTTAARGGFREVWTNDRHMLAAARHFGLRGRSVT